MSSVLSRVVRSSHARRAVTALTVTGAAVTALGVPAASANGAPASHTATSVVSAASITKPVGAGLYVLDTLNNVQPAIDHVFVNVTWSSLEPTRGNFNGAGWGTIQAALANPRAKLRLRILAGASAPTWLNSVSGPCVQVTSQAKGNSGCVPRFWTDAYLAEYQKLMQEVARRYDANPRVLDVVVSGPSTLTAEPFIIGGKAAGAALFSAGLNQTTFTYALQRSLAIHAAAFPNTRMSLATHMAWQIPVQGGITSSWPAERSILQQFRATYGTRLVLQNNGLANQTCSGTPSPDTATSLYCYLKAVGQPMGFQQGCGGKVSTCSQVAVLDADLALGGGFLEHARFSGLTATQAQYFDTALKHDAGL